MIPLLRMMFLPPCALRPKSATPSFLWTARLKLRPSSSFPLSTGMCVCPALSRESRCRQEGNVFYPRWTVGAALFAL